MLKLPVYLTGFSSKSDGSASLRFATQEISGDEFAKLKENLNAYGYLIFSPNEIRAEDIPTEAAEDKNKTPSKRLRAVKFIKWTQLGKQGNFEDFYRNEMEVIIEKAKKELDA